MSNWIDINLPWGRDYSNESNEPFQSPNYPLDIVDKKIRELFGKTEDEIYEAFEKQYQEPYYMTLRNGYDDIRDKLIEENPDSDFTDEEFEVMINARLDAIESPLLDAAKKVKQTLKQIQEISRSLPEVVAWSEECKKINEKKKEWEKTAFFRYSDLCRPGVLIEVLDDSDETPVPKKYLLGNINCVSGVCDDCTAFSRTAKVLRAKVLISPDDLK